MIFTLFLLAHFVGDFLLQTTWMVEWKYRSIQGLLFHTSLVTLAFIVLLFPYLPDWRVSTAIGLNFVLHTLQDHFKIKSSSRSAGPLVPFLSDQLMHVGLAVLLAFWVRDAQAIWGMDTALAWFYNNPLVPLYCLGVVLISYASDIFLYMLHINRHGSTRYVRNYRGMWVRVAVFSALFALGYQLS